MRLIPAVDRALREVEQLAECRRAEEAMRQSEHKYRELFESLEDAAFLADEESGKIIDVNRCSEALLECSRGEILGRKQHVFLKAGDLAFDKVIPGSSFGSELIRADGTTIPVHVHVTKLTLYGRMLMLRLCTSRQKK